MTAQSPPKNMRHTAEDALAAIRHGDSDVEIASVVADYLVAQRSRPLHYLSIFHDVRPSTVRRVEKLRKDLRRPDYQPQ